MRFDLKISKSSEEFTSIQLSFVIIGLKDRRPFMSSVYPGDACAFYLSDTCVLKIALASFFLNQC